MQKRQTAATIFNLLACSCLLLGCEEEASSSATQETAVKPTAAPEPTPPQAAEPKEDINAFKPATAKGKISFKDTKDGATLKGKSFMGAVAVKLNAVAEGVTIEEAGPVRQNAGHYYLIIDGEPVEQGKEVPKGPQYRRFDKGETELQAGLKPGTHTLTLQLVDGLERSYGPDWAHTIKVNVKEE